LCFIKNVFWEEEENVMQLRPPKSNGVNNHPFCLAKETDIPLPPSDCGGFKAVEKYKLR